VLVVGVELVTLILLSVVHCAVLVCHSSIANIIQVVSDVHSFEAIEWVSEDKRIHLGENVVCHVILFQITHMLLIITFFFDVTFGFSFIDMSVG